MGRAGQKRGISGLDEDTLFITSTERKPMILHLLRYQGFAVDNYDFTLDALNLEHPQPSLD